MPNAPLISIISVNYKQKQATIDFLKSLHTLSYKNIEVILVDNESSEDFTDVFSDAYKDVIYIREERNLGFAGGNNIGLKKARGDFFFFLNNDTEVTPHCIEPILELFNTDTSIGLVSPLIKFHWQKDLIQYAGFTDMQKFTLRNEALGYKETDKGQYTLPTKTYFAHGAAMMVRKEVLDTVGAMSEKFFLYYEEHDWCERIRQAGFSIYFQPLSVIYHKESLATGEDSAFKLFYINRNRILFSRRNYTFIHNIIFVLYYICVPLLRDIVKYTTLRKWKHLSASFNALFWNLTHYNIYG